MLETTEQVHTPVFLDTPISGTPQANSPLHDESVLTTGITQLWQVHCDYQTSIKHETEQFRALRNELGKLLHQMKELLARPGRSGQWSSFLKGHKIPRATADRLVQKHERSLSPHANCLTAQLTEPTEEEIQKLFAKVLPKLRRVLRTPTSLYRFIDLMTSAYDGIERRATDGGILVMKPLAQSEPAAQQDPIVETLSGEPPIKPTLVPDQSVVDSGEELM